VALVVSIVLPLSRILRLIVIVLRLTIILLLSSISSLRISRILGVVVVIVSFIATFLVFPVGISTPTLIVRSILMWLLPPPKVLRVLLLLRARSLVIGSLALLVSHGDPK
jgi:hypothetical protein